MKKAGISTACFYPEPGIDTLTRLAESGIKEIEFFANAPSESTVGYARRFARRAEELGLKVCAFHPFSSGLETFMLFTAYEQRRLDFIKTYRRYFEAAAEMGARVFHFHGAHSDRYVDEGLYFDVYARLYDLAEKEGVIFSQENVHNFISGKADFLKRMKDRLGDRVAFTLDVKQALWIGESPTEIRDIFGDSVVHLHLNNRNGAGQCTLPCNGDFDYSGFFTPHLRSDKVSGVIEVYRHNFSDEKELADAAEKINFLIG